MQISEAGFFFDGGLRNVGDSGLSGKWFEVLLWRLYDCLYELLFIRVVQRIIIVTVRLNLITNSQNGISENELLRTERTVTENENRI